MKTKMANSIKMPAAALLCAAAMLFLAPAASYAQAGPRPDDPIDGAYGAEDRTTGSLTVGAAVTGYEYEGIRTFDIMVGFFERTDSRGKPSGILKKGDARFDGICYQTDGMAEAGEAPLPLSDGSRYGYRDGYLVFSFTDGQYAVFSRIPESLVCTVSELNGKGQALRPDGRPFADSSGYRFINSTFEEPCPLPAGWGGADPPSGSDGSGVYAGLPVAAGDNGAVTVNNSFAAFGVEVDMDTIRRTSAAYSSCGQPAPDGMEGGAAVDNVGVEQFVYEIDFRSASSVGLDSFVAEIPLEGVAQGKIRLDEIWTPLVYGMLGENDEIDPDAKYRLFYKTDRKNDYFDPVDWDPWPYGLAASEPRQIFVYASSGGGCSLGLDDDDFITALKFDFGKVAPGFTSKNYASVSVNGEYRDGSGRLDTSRLGTDPSNGNAINANKGTWSSFAAMASGESPFAPLRAFAMGDEGQALIDWEDPNIPMEGGVDGSGFKGLPVTLVVHACRALSVLPADDIVGSAKAFGMLGGAAAQDQDAVITRNLGTPPPEAPAGIFSVAPQGALRIIAGALAGIALLACYMRSRKRRAPAGAGADGMAHGPKQRPKRRMAGKNGLLPLLIAGLLAGIAFHPAPAAAAPPRDSQQSFAVDGVFTERQFDAWLDGLVASGRIPPEARARIFLDPAGWTHEVGSIRAVEVTRTGFERNDVDLLYQSLDSFIAAAMDTEIEPGPNSLEAVDAAGKTRLADRARWAPTREDWAQMVEAGGVRFEMDGDGERPNLDSGRPLPGGTYKATAVCRGIEKVKGWSGFMAAAGDQECITAVVDYVTAESAAVEGT